MITVDEVLNDPDLCEPFSIVRTTGKFSVGGWVKDAPTTIPSFGAVRNTSGKEIDMLPEADRVHNTLTFRTAQQQIFETNDVNEQTSDILIFKGEEFRVLAVKDYSSQGYWLAIAARMKGN